MILMNFHSPGTQVHPSLPEPGSSGPPGNSAGSETWWLQTETESGPPGRPKLQCHYQCVFFFVTVWREKKTVCQIDFVRVPKIPPETVLWLICDTVTDLLRVALCERQFSCDMEHDFSLVKGCEDGFTSCLTMTHIQSSSEPESEEKEIMWF